MILKYCKNLAKTLVQQLAFLRLMRHQPACAIHQQAAFVLIVILSSSLKHNLQCHLQGAPFKHLSELLYLLLNITCNGMFKQRLLSTETVIERGARQTGRLQ